MSTGTKGFVSNSNFNSCLIFNLKSRDMEIFETSELSEKDPNYEVSLFLELLNISTYFRMIVRVNLLKCLIAQ